MINKPLSRQLTTIGLLAILNSAQPVADQLDRLFEPAERDAKGRFINMDKDESKVSIKVRAPFLCAVSHPHLSASPERQIGLPMMAPICATTPCTASQPPPG